MADQNTNRNPPASAMAEPAPKPQRAIRSALDDAVDETFPASDPVAMTDPSRTVREPVAPAHAKRGDVIGADGRIVSRAAAPALPSVGQDMLRFVWPWAVMGIAMQIWWMRRR